MVRARGVWRAAAAAFGIIVLAGAGLPEAHAEDVYEIDPVHSHVGFHVGHFGVGHVYGRFNRFSGKVVVTDDAFTDGRVELVIDAASIDTGNEKRDGHLKGPDFFNVKQFPKITFSSTGVTAAGEGSMEVEGTLSLHGVEKPVSATVTLIGHGADPRGNQRVGYEAKLTISRSAFGVSYMPGGIGDDVHITIAVEAVKK